MKKLLTISLLLLITVTIFANGNVNDNNTFVNSLPDRHRNYIIPPQPVIPDDDNSTQIKSSPDRRRHNIIPPNPVPPQNPVTISKTIDIKNIGKDVQIHIFNINGLEIKCDVNSLPNGKYFLLIKNGNEIYKEKIVILK